VDAKDLGGKTPIFYAIKEDSLDFIKGLILNNCDTNAQDGNGRTPLHLAVRNGYESVSRILLEEGGAEVNKGDFSQRTPLYYASGRGNWYCIDLLLKHGAKMDILDDKMRSPLHTAAGGGLKNSVAVKHLLATTNITGDPIDKFGRSPLSYAASHDKLDNLIFLHQRGATLNNRDIQGRTPLHFASASGHKDIVKYLIISGEIDVDVRDNNQRTPLYHAVSKGHLDVAKILIEAGADVNVREINGATPLHSAANKGNSEMVIYLINSGAKTDIEDHHQRTPLDHAVNKNHHDVVEILNYERNL